MHEMFGTGIRYHEWMALVLIETFLALGLTIESYRP